ncbi:MAG TPA: ABC transporter permease [Spirochaetia bacterium]|nr:ABC transporter permease [Spirochaetia bacterium]
MRSKGSLWRDAFRRLLRNRLAVAGGIAILAFAVIGAFAPLIAPHSFAQSDFGAAFAAPSPQYPLGADFLGRDMLSRLIYGTRISLLVGVIGALVAFTIGLLYGTISGYFGGRVDNVLMRIVDILYAFPGLLFIILLMVTFKSGFGNALTGGSPFVRVVAAVDKSLGGMLFIIVGISLTSWIGMARLSRGMALSLRETEFIQAAKAQGAGDLRIIVRELVPNLLGPLLISVTLAIPGFIGTEAFLSFIGLGVDPPTPSWGAMIADGFQAMRSYPHLALFPGIALAILMLSFNFLGDGLRDALDPRMKR